MFKHILLPTAHRASTEISLYELLRFRKSDPQHKWPTKNSLEFPEDRA